MFSKIVKNRFGESKVAWGWLKFAIQSDQKRGSKKPMEISATRKSSGKKNPHNETENAQNTPTISERCMIVSAKLRSVPLNIVNISC